MAISTAVDPSAVARVVGIKTEFKDLRGGNILFLPQRVALVGQGNSLSVYATTKLQVSSALQVAETYGFGSPLHLAAKELLPVNGDGIGTIPLTVYPLVDDVSGVAAAGDITPSGAQTEAASYVVRVNNIDSQSFVINPGDAVAAIIAAIVTAVNANLDMPVIAADGTTVVNIAAKWAGASSNDLNIEVIGSTTAGTTFAITQPAGGLVNPDVDDALNQVGNVWESLFVNCMEIADTATLDKYSAFGEGRWGALVRKPLGGVFTGNTATTVTSAIVITDARKTDRTNSQLPGPSSKNLPFVIAARQVARIAVVANNRPAHDYGSQDVTGIIPGPDSDQWTYPERDQAVKAGSSTVTVEDGVINIADVVTMYHPTGDPLPAYRFVVDIIKLQQVLFNLDLEFATTKWDGAPLIPDDQATVEPTAKKPKSAITAISAIIDNLALNAIISDPETAKASIQAEIDAGNPKRLNISMTIQLSGNSNIISIDNNFGFFFGIQAIAA